MKNLSGKIPWLLPASILGICAVSITVFSGSVIGVKLYPVLVNVAMLVVFLFSYFKPPTVIETFARIREPHLPEEAINYTKNVTLVWCMFFVINGSISLFTVFFSTMEVWTFYNGFLSYLLIAILMACEYMIRIRFKKRYQSADSLTAERNKIDA